MLPVRYTTAWLNGAHRVLGLRLRPYCLWYRFALEAIESPFLDPNGRPTFGDLEIAVRICRSQYPREDAADFTRSLAARLSLGRRFQLGVVSRLYDLPAHGAAFVRYIREFQSLPEFWQESGEPTHGTSGHPPETLSVAAQLIRAGFDERRAWTMPIGRAFWYAATFARLSGVKIEFVSESKALFEGLRRLKALCDSGKLTFHQKGIIYRP